MNVLNWFEIPTVDIARAAVFYEKMTGKSLRREVFMNIPHAIFVPEAEAEGAVAGALVQDPRNSPSETGCVVYLNAGSDLDGWISRASAAGGKVLLPRTSIGPQGSIAIVIDSEGNRVGLHCEADALTWGGMPPVRVLVALAPGSPDAAPFRSSLLPFGNAIELMFAEGRELEQALPEAEVVVAQRLDEAQIERAGKLRWLSSWAAGLETVARPSLASRGVLLTNASGVHGPNIAEHVLGMMLSFVRRLHRLRRAQLERRWERDHRSRSEGFDELTGKTLLIVGLGRIGEALAVRARPFGMTITAIKRDPSSRHDPGVVVDELAGLERLDELLARADHVVLALPLTPATHHLFDRARLARMKPGAYLYNIGRGPLIDEPALIAALEAGALAGAGLDVFEQEPLPASSPLWDLESVIVTPHVSGLTPHYFERAAALFADNLHRYLAGEPLENRYEAARGY